MSEDGTLTQAQVLLDMHTKMLLLVHESLVSCSQFLLKFERY